MIGLTIWLGSHYGSKFVARVECSARRRLSLGQRRPTSQRNAKNRCGQSSQCEFHTVLLKLGDFLNSKRVFTARLPLPFSNLLSSWRSAIRRKVIPRGGALHQAESFPSHRGCVDGLSAERAGNQIRRSSHQQGLAFSLHGDLGADRACGCSVT